MSAYVQAHSPPRALSLATLDANNRSTSSGSQSGLFGHPFAIWQGLISCLDLAHSQTQVCSAQHKTAAVCNAIRLLVLSSGSLHTLHACTHTRADTHTHAGRLAVAWALYGTSTTMIAGQWLLWWMLQPAMSRCIKRASACRRCFSTKSSRSGPSATCTVHEILCLLGLVLQGMSCQFVLNC